VRRFSSVEGLWRAAARLLLPLLLLPVAAAADEAEELTSVRDLRYGVALYEFHQENYFQSLTELLLGEAKADMPHHGEFARLLRGGISLSYGLNDAAERIFDELLAAHSSPAVRDRAWFYLGKSYYQRGERERAADYFARSGSQLPKRLAAERDYLVARIALDRGESVVIADNARMTPWLPYLIFNASAAQAKRGDWQGAVSLLDRLAALPLRDEEHKALRDRGFTVAGYSYLSGGQPAAAEAQFRRVRLNSPLVDKALLGYGWAAAQQGDYRAALKPWLALRERPVISPAVQEVLLALPHAYEELGDEAQALAEYERAEQALLAEVGRVDAAIVQLRDMPLLSVWLDDEAQRGESEWLPRERALPVRADIPYLEQLLASNPVQEVIRDLRDLAALQRYLGDWRGRLDALDTAQLLQYQRRQTLLGEQPQQQLAARETRLREQREQLAERLRQATTAGDGVALMNDEELAQWQRLQRVERNLEALAAAGRDVGAQRERFERLRGLLVWQAQEQFPARRHDLDKALRDVDATLAQTSASQQRLAALVGRAQTPEQGPRIDALDARLTTLLQRIDAAQRSGESLLRRRAEAELTAHRQRLQAYLGRTRLAMARLYDKGSTGGLQ
jgi:hypothetical protein